MLDLEEEEDPILAVQQEEARMHDFAPSSIYLRQEEEEGIEVMNPPAPAVNQVTPATIHLPPATIHLAPAASSSSSSNSLPSYYRLHPPLTKKRRLQHMAGAENEGRRPRGANWDAQMDRFLVDLMIKEMHRKNYPCANFNIHSWNSITNEFNSTMGLTLSYTQVRDHWRNIKKKFALYEELLHLSGWGWDDEHKCPIAPYDGAWEEVVKVNLSFSTIRRRSFPLYDDIHVLCKNSMATGVLAEGINRRGAQGMSSEARTSNTMEHIDELCNAIPITPCPQFYGDQFQPHNPSSETPEMMNISHGQQSHTSDMGSASPKRKKGETFGKTTRSKKTILAASLDNLAEVGKRRNELIEDMRPSGSGRSEHIPTLSESLAELRSIHSLSYEVYLKAMNLFTKVETRQLFSVMPKEDKVSWIHLMTKSP